LGLDAQRLQFLSIHNERTAQLVRILTSVFRRVAKLQSVKLFPRMLKQMGDASHSFGVLQPE
jgi:hypothetical protein